MTRKSKRKGKGVGFVKETKVEVDIPIPNLPEKFLWMHVNSGTKIRNVLTYALREFPIHKSVVWSGAGQGIGKVITCAEICKKKNPGLHQITKLRYIKSKKADTGNENDENRRVPEIHILLSKDPLDPSEPGHQSSIDRGLFLSRRSAESVTEDNNKSSDKYAENQLTKKEGQSSEASTSKLSNVATEEFAAMGLRTGHLKRSHKGNQTTEATSSNNKSRKKGKNN